MGGGRPRGPAVRAAPIVLLLAALVPTGAYELLVLFGCQAAVVIGGIRLADFWAGFRRARQQGLGVRRAIGQVVAQLWGEGPRFPLRELLAGVLLAAAVLAIVRNGPVDAVATRDVLNNPGPWIAAGIALGITTLAAIGIVFGSRAGMCDWLSD